MPKNQLERCPIRTEIPLKSQRWTPVSPPRRARKTPHAGHNWVSVLVLAQNVRDYDARERTSPVAFDRLIAPFRVGGRRRWANRGKSNEALLLHEFLKQFLPATMPWAIAPDEEPGPVTVPQVTHEPLVEQHFLNCLW